ncbi:hypothetical protein GQ54DRAFT_295142 [Martensiomyces pterosporus]|nr:hypothetical protein GQ54DRAFT_295142 [Martensiomyces pterosporus]
MTERSLETEQKRLVRADAALIRKHEQLEKARETVSKTSDTTVRYRNAAARIERLEGELRQLEEDRREIKLRMREIEAQQTQAGAAGAQESTTLPEVRVKQEHGEPPASSHSILSMIMPKRRAAIAAEQRRHALIRGSSADDDRDAGSAYPVSPGPGSGSGTDEYTSDHSRDYSTGTGAESAMRRKAASKSDSADDSYHEDNDNDNDSDINELDTTLQRSPAARRSYGATADGHDADDGNEQVYQERVYNWCIARWRERQALGEGGGPAESSSAVNPADYIEVDGERIPKAALAKEPFLPDPGATDHIIRAFDSSNPPLAVPRQVWDRLLEYQRAAIQWMFALHQQNAGGILGDEMGLGKTVQVAGFLASLYHSQLLSRPSIVVCPATLMRQWVREFHTWWPSLRVVILHATGHGMKPAINDAPGQRSQQYDTADTIPAEVEDEIWDTAHRENQEFVRSVGSSDEGIDADASHGYDSTDDYEYDAYGSRVRRKRNRGVYGGGARQRPKKKKKQRVISKATRASRQRAERLVDRVHKNGHVVIVTYSGLQVYQDALLHRKWGYAVLDEGHMIRNPDAEATLACKRLDTRHRILVTGTPIQNNLTELWSLFDFIFPGRLGTLPVFNNQFATPITVGGYASANSLQVRAAYRCACILRDLIDPYLLRRLKADVAHDLPQKTEQVLFCRLTPIQRSAYKSFLRSEDMERILSGKLQMLFGVDVARKICDHPDLLLLSTLPSAAATYNEARHKGARPIEGSRDDAIPDPTAADSEYEFMASSSRASSGMLPPDYGDWQKSGKLTIVRALLDMWKPHGHKVLIFSQTRQMLDIIERMVVQMPDSAYRRMDGATPVQHRAALVDEFNRDPSIFLFLLTTKVGGLGINLTGADRVILYSPDWNPSSDMQARERAWRLGQTRDVAVYRLMTAGTIEEKIYNRQIYKQFLSNKILSDPKQKRVFQSQSLRDLFSLSGFDAGEEVVAGVNASADSRVGNSRDQPFSGASARGDGDSALASPRHTPGGAPTPVTETGMMFANARLLPKATRSSRVHDGANADVATSNSISVGSSEDAPNPTSIDAIGGVVRLEAYRHISSDGDGDENAAAAAPQADSADNAAAEGQDEVLEGEDRVLQSLFKMSGIHSALKHDAIVNGDEQEMQVIEEEAERIASEARTALRESQRSRRQLDVHVPTWTGSSGQAGMPTPRGQGQAFGGKVSPNLVAPPPSAITSNELPAEVRFRGLQALGGSRRRNLPPASHPPQESVVHNAVSMVRRANLDRQLPSSRTVSSLSVNQGPGAIQRSQGSARSEPLAGPQFGSHAVSGMYSTASGDGGAISSASLLANLKARSTGIQAAQSSVPGGGSTIHSATGSTGRHSKAAPLATGATSQQQRPAHSGRIQRLHAPAHEQHTGSSKLRSRGLPAAVRAHGSSAGGSAGRVGGGGGRDARCSSGGSENGKDAEVVERIRSVLVQHGGEMSNRMLIEQFESEFSVAELPRLKELALRVADMVTRQPESDMSRVGIGRVVQRAWRLRDSPGRSNPTM